MNHQSVTKKFRFHDKIDKEFIFNLYEDDYLYIVQLFETSLEGYAADVAAVETAYRLSDIPGLKKAVHKIKPVFGFTGLLEHQEQLARFENHCALVTGTAAIAADYQKLIQVLAEGKQILEHEHKRLAQFTESL